MNSKCVLLLLLVVALVCVEYVHSEVIFSVDSLPPSSHTPNHVLYRIHNPTHSSVEVLLYGTAFEEPIMFPVLNIHSQFHYAQYSGPVARRVSPAPSDAYISIPAMSSIERIIDINELYSVSSAAYYDISVNVPHFDSSIKEKIQSTPMNMYLLDNLVKEVDGSSADNSFENCDASEEAIINQSVPVALQQADNAQICMAQDSCNTLTTKWFGSTNTSDIANYNYDADMFVSLYDSLKDDGLNSYCNPSGCGPFVYAYVYPSDPAMTVYLCGAFWSQPDERANTIVHEVSHFNVIGGTNDYAYGQPDCLILAQENPTLASHNADNVCYFSAEA